MSNMLEMIGQTPLIRLNKIAKYTELQCDLCKYMHCVCICRRRKAVNSGGAKCSQLENFFYGRKSNSMEYS